MLLHMLKMRSFQKREVKLSSGKTSDFYIDCRKTFLSQIGMALCARALREKLFQCVTELDWKPCQYVAGTGLGGGALGAAMVIDAHHEGNVLDMVYVRDQRKEHGTRSILESPGKPSTVFVVEDVITTGASAMLAIHELRMADYDVQGVLALVDREEGGVEAINGMGVAAGSIFKKSDFFT